MRRGAIGGTGEGTAGGIGRVESEESDLTDFGVDDAGATASIHGVGLRRTQVKEGNK